jgi:hypothetical protein
VQISSNCGFIDEMVTSSFFSIISHNQYSILMTATAENPIL